jgi:hypothetical protein
MVGTPRCGVRTAQRTVPANKLQQRAAPVARFFFLKTFAAFAFFARNKKGLFDGRFANGKTDAWQNLN